MQVLEICILITLLISSCTLFTKPGNRPNSLIYLPFLALFLVLLHALVEGVRWQMMPAYLLSILFLYQSIRFIKRQMDLSAYRDRKWLRVIGAVCSMLLLIVSTVLALILPVFDLPAPTGPYTVGTTTFMLEDSTREEIITINPGDHRKLMVRAWYPAEDKGGETERMDYMHPFEAKQFAQKYGLPAFTLNHLRHTKTHVFEQLTVSDQLQTYPVLLFSHGYNVPPATYAAILTEIASHGYIIMAVNHPYQSVATVFPDGERTSFDYEYSANTYEGVWPKIAELEEQFWAAERDSVRLNIIREINEVYPNSEMIRLWAEDLSFVIDQIGMRNKNQDNLFFERLNLEQLGAFGHSAGGASAGQLLLDDDRIKAGINLDGAQWGNVIDSTFVQPFMRIEAVRDSSTFAPNDLIYHDGSETAMYDLKLKSFGHSNFSDIPFLIPVPPVNEAGSIDPYHATQLITDYLTAFFDKYLRNEKEINLTDLNKKYPEGKLEIK